MYGTTHKLDASAGHTCKSHTSTLASEVMPSIQHVCVSICFTHKHSTGNAERSRPDSQWCSVVLPLSVPLNGCFFFLFPLSSHSFQLRQELCRLQCRALTVQMFKPEDSFLSSFRTRAVVKAASLRQSAAEIIRKRRGCGRTRYFGGRLMSCSKQRKYQKLEHMTGNLRSFQVFSFLCKMIPSSELLINYDWLIAVRGQDFTNQISGL